MQYLFMALFALGIVAADQLSKHWVVHNISSSFCRDSVACAGHLEKLCELFHITKNEMSVLPQSAEGIPGFFELTFVHNTGAVFSFLEDFGGRILLFSVIFILLTIALLWEFPKKRLPFTTFERWCIVAIYAGGLGNTIDRLSLGFVIDMIDLEFNGLMSFLNSFAVFNVADCFITCGCIGLMLHLIFFNKEFWKDEKK